MIARHRRFVLVGSLAVAMVLASQASAFEVSPPELGRDAGQRLIVHGETVSVTVVGAVGGFDNRLALAEAPDEEILACTSAPIGFTAFVGEFETPTELVMTLTTPEDRVWVTGPGTDNADEVPHARLTVIGADRVLMEWEDLSGGGDADYNDCVVELLITPIP